MSHPTPTDPNYDPTELACASISGPVIPSPTAELSSLAAQIRELTTRLEDLDTRTAELSDALTDRVLPHLAQLHTTTANHTTRPTPDRRMAHALETRRPTGHPRRHPPQRHPHLRTRTPPHRPIRTSPPPIRRRTTPECPGHADHGAQRTAR
jgi:hypothetical protein